MALVEFLQKNDPSKTEISEFDAEFTLFDLTNWHFWKS